MAGTDHGSRRLLTRRGWRRVLWWAGLAALFTAAAVDYGIWWTIFPTLMIGTIIFSPSVWVYTALGVSLCCWIAVLLLHESVTPTSVKFGRLRRVVVAVIVVVGLAGVLPMTVFTGFTAESQYRVLSPGTPAGCRVVTSMAPMLEGTAGYVYLSTPGSIVLHRVPTSWFSYWWWSNDGSNNGYNPIDAGEWSLCWDGDQGYLSIRLRGLADDGHSATLTCPRR
ncbi:MAG: hypothetical protein ABF780_01455 [Bifidobacterium aquikefiri]|uniref:Uncharacterized protein n=1 Tax=Bifidobacterium aquikefiri TaxID=1653207 RepID=A0A261GBH8_9BIFI|nr:hypothetical protein [Bifidobacterium aquikefiri]OZG68787.1 hypothetical protein BAQU_0088 [Bifidobacterium aquikefiri]